MKVPSGGLGGIAGHNVTLLYPEDAALPLTLETGCSLNLHLPIKKLLRVNNYTRFNPFMWHLCFTCTCL